MRKRSLSTKKKLEELSSRLASGNRHGALLVKTPQYVRQYVLATEASSKCLELGRSCGKEVLRKYLSELRELFDRSIDITAKRSELRTLDETGTQRQVDDDHQPKTVDDMLFALMETWSEPAPTPASLASQVVLSEAIVAEACSAIKEEEDTGQEEGDDNDDESESMVSEAVDGSEFPLSMLLELAVKHYNEEYGTLLSESQMQFMMNYVSMDPDRFAAKVLIPLEEHTKRSIDRLVGDPSFSDDQVQTVTGLLERFQSDRRFVSDPSHPQHPAALDFYLSLIDLTEKINLTSHKVQS